MLNSFSPSGQKSPCPICGRTKDGDCRILSDGRVFCHTAKSGIKGKKCDSNEIYIYLGKSDEAQGAGMWKLDETAPAKTHRAKTPRQYGIRYFDYFFWDGAAVPAQRYRKDVEGQPKEVKWGRGGLGGRSQNEVAPYLWEKASGAKQLFVVRGELKAELLCGKGFAAISLLNQKDEVLVSKLQAMRADGVEIVLVPDCDEADLDKWFRYLSNEVSGVKQLLAPGLPWANPPADGGLGIEDWIYAKSPSNEQILAAISSTEAIDQDAKDLNTLKNRISSIISENPIAKDKLALSRKKANELGFSLSANEIKGYIEDLSYVELIPYSHTNPMPYEGESKIWGDLLLYDSTNLIVAPPKVGKTALILHLFGCMLRGESHCLGQPIHNRCKTLIVVGNDMTTMQWGRLLIREGLGTLVGLQVIPVPELIIFAKDRAIQLNEQGIQTIKNACTYNRNSMLLVDTIRSQTSSLGLDENSREAVKPLENLFNALAAAKSKTTTIILHHAKKAGGASAIDASAGSSAIPAAFDQTLNMNWLSPAESGLQEDRRILVSSSGRGSQDQQIVVELVGQETNVRWISHGNAKDLIKAEAILRVEEGLSAPRARVYDQGQTLYQSGKGIRYRAVMELLQCSRFAANRHLAAIHRAGLFIRTGNKGNEGYIYYPHYAERIEEGSALSSNSADLGGVSDLKGVSDPPSNLPDLDQSSPSFLTPPSISPSKTAISGDVAPFQPILDQSSSMCTLSKKKQPSPPLETEFSIGSDNSSDPLVSLNALNVRQCAESETPPDPLVSLNARNVRPFNNSLSSSSSLKEPIPTSFLAGLTSNERALYVNDSANDTETLKPQLEQAVQVFRKGEWESGWTICDSRNPHSLRIRTERDGKVFQLANQRWEIDLRPEPLEVPASPSKADARATELDTSSEDLQRASIRVEMPATDAERDSFF